MKNDNNKNWIGDIMHLAGVILIGTGFFFGLHYVTLNLLISIPCTLILMGTYIFIVYVLKRLKTVEEYHSVYKPTEYGVLFVGFPVLAIVTFYFFSHFININMDVKSSVIAKTESQLEEASQLFVNYKLYTEDRKQKFTIALKSAWDSRNRELCHEYGLELTGPASFSTQSEQQIKNLEEALLPSEYEIIKEKAEQWIFSAKHTISSWNYFNLGEPLKNINDNIEGWINYLNELSQTTNFSKKEPFTYRYSSENLIDKLTDASLINQKFTLSALLLAILLALVLMPYFLLVRSETIKPKKFRDTHNDGSSTWGTNEQIQDDLPDDSMYKRKRRHSTGYAQNEYSNEPPNDQKTRYRNHRPADEGNHNHGYWDEK